MSGLLMSLTNSETPQCDESEPIHKRRSSGSRARSTAATGERLHVVEVPRHQGNDPPGQVLLAAVPLQGDSCHRKSPQSEGYKVPLQTPGQL
jgi:hypothetical protein